MIFIQVFIYTLLFYILSGVLYGLWFILKGVERLDQKTVGAGWKLRLLLFPAAVGLWPLLINLINRNR